MHMDHLGGGGRGKRIYGRNFFCFAVLLMLIMQDTSKVKYEIIYQLDAVEYLFVLFHLVMFRAYTPIFRSNGCYNFFTYAAYVKKL